MPLEERLQAAVDRFLDEHDIPGLSAAVVRNGRLVSVVSGHADLDGREPIGSDDQFRLASITKTYIAALALSLHAEGVVPLDSPIGPWVAEAPPSLGLEDLTMRQLLSHTSGMAQTFTDDLDRGVHLELDDVLDRIPTRACDPGRCWSYADANYVIAAMVLDAATPKTLETELRDRFFEPLALGRTHFVGDPRADPLPQYHLVVDPATFEPVRPHRLRPQALPLITDPRAATLVATAADLARWGDALFGGRAISRSALEAMVDTSAARDLPCPRGCPVPGALGVFHFEFGGREFIGHDGSSGAIVASDPGAGLTIAILTNGGEREVGKMFEAVLRAVDGR